MMEEFARMVELCEEKLLIISSYFWYLKKYEADLNKSRLADIMNLPNRIHINNPIPIQTVQQCEKKRPLDVNEDVLIHFNASSSFQLEY